MTGEFDARLAPEVRGMVDTDPDVLAVVELLAKFRVDPALITAEGIRAIIGIAADWQAR